MSRDRELAEAADELIEAAHHWIDEHDQSVAGAGLDPSSLKELVAVATRAWAETPNTEPG